MQNLRGMTRVVRKVLAEIFEKVLELVPTGVFQVFFECLQNFTFKPFSHLSLFSS